MAGIAQRLRWLELADAALPKSADTGARLRLIARFERLADRQGVSGGAPSAASQVVQRALAEAPDGGPQFWSAVGLGVRAWLRSQ